MKSIFCAYPISLESESLYSGESDERDGAGDGMELPYERGDDDLGDSCVGVGFGRHVSLSGLRRRLTQASSLSSSDKITTGLRKTENISLEKRKEKIEK